MSNGANWQRSTDSQRGFDEREISKPCYAARGFLPAEDPMRQFPPGSPYRVLDEIGRDLPSLLQDSRFRQYAKGLKIPAWQGFATESSLPALRLYYVRLGFLASAYVNQVGQEPCQLLPANLAVPLTRVCKLLKRPPILSYDGYALYNWKRFQQHQPIRLGNIDTIQNFVHLYDERWFILIHIEIEAIAADILSAIARISRALKSNLDENINSELGRIAAAVERMVRVLKQIPEKMDPELYFKTFRPYIRFFENVVYEGVDQKPIRFRGETGAQSSVMPVLVALMKVPHRSSMLTQHLTDMRNYMPSAHKRYIEEVSDLPSFRHREYRNPFNAILEAVVEFRQVHYGWASEYINKRVADPRGTGGTPYMKWLQQLIAETEAFKL